MPNKHIGSSLSSFLHEEGVPPTRYRVRLKPGVDRETAISRLKMDYGLSEPMNSEWNTSVFSAWVPDHECLIKDSEVQAVGIDFSYRKA